MSFVLKQLKKTDPEIAKLAEAEIKRQQSTINLIASENYVSLAVLEILGSPLTNKYSEGYPGKRYYPGNENYDQIDLLVEARALELYGLEKEGWHVNVQPLSGSPANLAIYAALMKPCKDDILMGLNLSSGGHLTHGHPVSFSGKFWKTVQYSVDPSSGLLNYDEVERLAMETRPKIIVSGFTAYPRIIDFERFGKIAEKVGAYHVVDMSHFAGLVAGGVYPSPFPYADVVMTTTHKTLRGPRAALIFVNRKSKTAEHYGIDIASEIDKAVFPGLQGGPHNNVIAAIGVALKEASTSQFRNYARQIVKNACALAEALKKLGLVLVTGGTDSHLLLVDLRPLGLDGKAAEEKLKSVGITANRNTIPGDTKPLHPSGIRLGTPALTTRGMKEKEMKEIAGLVYEALTSSEPRAILKKVKALCRRFPIKK